MKDQSQKTEDILNAIATQYFGVDDLVQDVPPLFNVSLEAIREALRSAFNAGRNQSSIEFYDKTYKSLGVYNDEGVNVKSSLLIDALKDQVVQFDGHPGLDFGLFNYDDLDEVDGEIRFYPVNNETREPSACDEKVISFSEIEKGQLDSKGYFECVDIGGYPVRITSPVLVRSVQQGDKMSEVLSQVSMVHSEPSL